MRHGIGLLDDDDDWNDDDPAQFPRHGNRNRNAGDRRAHGDRAEWGDRGGGHRGGRGGGGRRDNLVVNTRLLERLAAREEADIVMTLASPKTSIRDALMKSVHDSDTLTLLLKVLAKGFTCNSLPEQLNRLMVIIKEAKFFDTGNGSYLLVYQLLESLV